MAPATLDISGVDPALRNRLAERLAHRGASESELIAALYQLLDEGSLSLAELLGADPLTQESLDELASGQCQRFSSTQAAMAALRADD